MEDIHGIRPPVQAGFDPTPVLIGLCIIAGLLILAGLYLFIKKKMSNHRKAAQPSEKRVVRCPYDEAVKHLDRLSLKIDKDPRLFYFDLNIILRKYVGRSFGVAAVEMTSQEFIRVVQKLDLQTSIKQAISQFQSDCDPIKYAGVLPEKEQLENDLSKIRTLIKTLETDRIEKEKKEQAQLSDTNNPPEKEESSNLLSQGGGA